MVGITAYGAYIPWHRINRMTIYWTIGFVNQATIAPGEKAVANYDEDSLSMAVNAGADCLTGIDRSKIDGLYLATTTAPYKERQNAGIISTALDLKPEARSADFTASLKAGTTAVLAACDAVKAETANNILVCASDCRLGPAGSFQEENYGDAAAAVLAGDSRDPAMGVPQGPAARAHSRRADLSMDWQRGLAPPQRGLVVSPHGSFLRRRVTR